MPFHQHMRRAGEAPVGAGTYLRLMVFINFISGLAAESKSWKKKAKVHTRPMKLS